MTLESIGFSAPLAAFYRTALASGSPWRTRIEDAGIERGAQNTAEGQQPRFVTCICSSYSAREGEAA